MRQTLGEIYEARAAAGALTPDPAQRAVLPVLEDLRAMLESAATRKRGLLAGFLRGNTREAAPRGLYLWGGVGRGKSMMMDLFFAATAVEGKRRVHFHAFMQEVHRGMHAARKRGVDDALAPVAAQLGAGLRLLCFDEMQITDITDAMIVGRLFQMLMDGGTAIVTTSNRPPDDLYLNGLNRQLFLPFIALLKERLAVMELASLTDYRQDRLAGAQVYFAPADAAARAAIETIWTDLTGGGPGAALSLSVTGREVVLERVHNGVARATFWELCGRPLGPADYLAIAGAVGVLILEDIPRLSAANYNEAKRFVTLVDAIYEARIPLIASAADEPERLYAEGAGTFEFERTASRLREMQGADWGRAGAGATGGSG